LIPCVKEVATEVCEVTMVVVEPRWWRGGSCCVKPTTHFRFLSTLVSSTSSSSRRRNANASPLHLRRNTTTSTTPMEDEENSSVGFNKRRAEGADKSGLPKKNLQLKVRKLNPINTISYVQVTGWFYFFLLCSRNFQNCCFIYFLVLILILGFGYWNGYSRYITCCYAFL